MTDTNTIKILSIADLAAEKAAEKRGPTIGERLAACKGVFIDETNDPGEDDALSFPKQIVAFVKNFRGWRKGERGRRHEAAFMDGMVIHNWPEFIPFAEVDAFCEEILRLRDAGVVAIKKADK